MSRIVRLLVVVQNNLHRRGLEPLLQGMVSHFQIVRLVRSSSEIAAAITQTQFDVLLLDDDLTDDVFSILRQIRHQVPDKPIVLLSDILFPRYIELVLLNGVSGVIYWHDALETALPHVVYTVLQAGHSASPKVTSVMLAHRAQPTAVDLSETDWRVLRLIDEGHSMKAIARMLKLNQRSVYRARSRLEEVLGIPSHEHLIAAAREQGLLGSRRADR